MNVTDALEEDMPIALSKVTGNGPEPLTVKLAGRQDGLLDYFLRLLARSFFPSSIG